MTTRLPLSLTIASLLAALPVAITVNSQASDIGASSIGDLEIYKGGLPIEQNGENEGLVAEQTSGNAILLMLDLGSIGRTADIDAYNAHFVKMKLTLEYLMSDSSVDGLSENTLVGVGTYPSSAVDNKNLSGDDMTGVISIPVAQIGPMGSAHRRKIINYMRQLSSTSASSPMASAYAEAGAYMMGTTTSVLSKDSQLAPITRVLRKDSANNWEYCRPEKRLLNKYIQNGNITYRHECDFNSGWEAINPSNVAPYTWAGMRLQTSPPTSTQVAMLNKATPSQRQYDLLWGTSANPLGVTAVGHGYSPTTLLWTNYEFKYDDFDYQNPTDNNPMGHESITYDYYSDNNLQPIDPIEPDFRYRALRKKYFVVSKVINNVSYDVGKEYWEYCKKGDEDNTTEHGTAELVNYIYSSYRYICNEEDWIPIYTITDMARYGFTKNTWWLLGNRPSGVDSRYIYDAVANPYDGWQYYYDTAFDSEDMPALPTTPTTLISESSVSGIRHSPPEVRVKRSYSYDQPNYRVCQATDGQYQSNPNNRAAEKDANSAEKQAAIVQNVSIFFITAGIPSAADLAPISAMNQSLNKSVEINGSVNQQIMDDGILKQLTAGANPKYVCDTSGLTANPLNSHWGCIGAYARRLNDVNNPTTRPIKTGVFLIAGSNLKINPNTCEVEAVTTQLLNIENPMQTASYKNACQLGSREYGDGGFYLTDTSNTAASIKAFAKAIKERTEALGGDPYEFGVVASGAMQVPANSLRPGALTDSGYLPMIAPNVGSGKSQWGGNLRRYQSSAAGYVGKDNITPDSTSPVGLMNGSTRDVWAAQWVASQSQGGGIYENIKTPIAGNSVGARRIYLSSSDSTELTEISPTMEGVNSIAQVKIFTAADEKDMANVDSRDLVVQRLLLNYMGYRISDYNPSDTNTTNTDTILASVDANNPHKIMGAVVHSTPVSFVSKATINGTNYDPDEEYILFGAMDNALHVVKKSNGEEVFSYFPREVLKHKGQYKGITPEITGDTLAGDNTPTFGVDGPWAVYASYLSKDDGQYIEADKIYAYGGARMGAKAYYGLDLTGIHNDADPKQLFTITNKGAFTRLGYGWGKPVITKIRWQGQPKSVVILSGGYDEYYDASDEERFTSTDANGNGAMSTYRSIEYSPTKTTGNAIYIMDAKTGKPLIVASSSGADTGDTSASNADGAFVTKDSINASIAVLNSHLKYSIPGSVKVLDRDADELADHIYFADLEGQVFRMDINNAASTMPTKITSKDGTNPEVRVVRIADLNADSHTPGPRFYEAPAVTIQQNNKGHRFATVSVASGDRSNPLSKNMDGHINALYTLYDKDVAQSGLFGSGYQLSRLITVSSINQELGVQTLAGTALDYDKLGTLSAQTVAQSAYQKYTGWLSLLNQYDSTARGTDSNAASPVATHSIKALGEISAIANKLYVPAYNPDDGKRHATDACLPEVLGTTEIHQYCLPYGICDKRLNTQYQRFTMGKGIMSPAFGTDYSVQTEDSIGVNKVNEMSRSLIDASGNPIAAQGLNIDAPSTKSSFAHNGFLRPLAWFDMQSKRVE